MFSRTAKNVTGPTASTFCSLQQSAVSDPLVLHSERVVGMAVTLQYPVQARGEVQVPGPGWQWALCLLQAGEMWANVMCHSWAAATKRMILQSHPSPTVAAMEETDDRAKGLQQTRSNP